MAKRPGHKPQKKSPGDYIYFAISVIFRCLKKAILMYVNKKRGGKS
jgi:hypothetical protein